MNSSTSCLPLEKRSASAARMPEREHDNFTWHYAVVDVISNARVVDPAKAGITRCSRARTDPGLACHQSLGFIEIYAECLRSGRPILSPPAGGLLNLRRRARGNLNREHFAQEIRRNRSSSSAAEMVSP